MTIGGSIFLLALGGILAFAVRDGISGVDLTVVGYILMLAGLVGLAAGLMLHRKGTTMTETTQATDNGAVRRQEIR